MILLGTILSFIISPFKLMLNLFLSLPQKMQAVILIIVAIIAMFFYAKHIGIKECKKEQSIADAKQVETFNEISTHRPDTDALISKLRSGKF